MQALDLRKRIIAYAAATLAGYVDATGFLATDRYFVSFMSGNTTRMGVDLLARPRGAALAAVLIVGFVAGVVIGALVAEWAGFRRKPAVLGCCAALLASGAGLAFLGSPDVAVLTLLVLAMGVLNNTFQRDGEVSVGLTYMTGALVRFGQGLANRLVGREGQWAPWLGLWATLALGALAGAAAWPLLAWNSLWLATALALLLSAAAMRAIGSP
jgi:uncharacterized membrane protein YoaK (UPF0700 family)